MTDTQYRLLSRVSGNMNLLPVDKADNDSLRTLADAVKAGRARARFVILDRDPMALAHALSQAADRLRRTGHKDDATDADDLAFLVVMWNRRGLAAGPLSI